MNPILSKIPTKDLIYFAQSPWVSKKDLLSIILYSIDMRMPTNYWWNEIAPERSENTSFTSSDIRNPNMTIQWFKENYQRFDNGRGYLLTIFNLYELVRPLCAADDILWIDMYITNVRKYTICHGAKSDYLMNVPGLTLGQISGSNDNRLYCNTVFMNQITNLITKQEGYTIPVPVPVTNNDILWFINNANNPINWGMLSRNPIITLDFIRSYPDFPWSWQDVNMNPSLTPNDVEWLVLTNNYDYKFMKSNKFHYHAYYIGPIMRIIPLLRRRVTLRRATKFANINKAIDRVSCGYIKDNILSFIS
jgi:hypothetical protein